MNNIPLECGLMCDEREGENRAREREREMKTVCVVLYCSRCSMARSVTLGRESIARNENGYE